MLITFKTLQQKTFKIEIDETEKVKALKEKIAEERGDEFPIEGQKLIYSGKILDDEKIISEYNIDPVKNFVVVMAVKPKAKPAEKPKDSSTEAAATSSQPVTESTTTTTVSSASTTSTTPSTAAASETTAEAVSTTSNTQQTTVSSAESALLTGSALESSITELMSLGYPRDQVIRALNSSFHNADRAAEYLLSGNIPDLPVADAEGGDSEAQNEGSEAVPAGSSAPVPAGDLNFLRNLPQFQLMQNQVQEHPETLPQLLQEIGRSNPQLLQFISQNQEAFIQLLNERSTPEGEGDGAGDSGSGDAAGRRGAGFQIQVTPEEKAAIDRIVAMGFAESEVIQAYFACDKNEQLAIDLLLN